jgi:hypothetical protein
MWTHSTPLRRAARIAALGLLLILATTLAAPAQGGPPGPAAVGTSITWATTPQIITNVTRANFPWVAVDASDKTHVVFISRNDSLKWELRYINNVAGTFNSPGQLIETMESNPAVPSAIILAGPGNLLHLVYLLSGGNINQIYYRQSADRGATWSARQLISSGSGKSAAPNATLDSAGNVHITWIYDQCGSSIYNVYYRARLANGTLSGTSKPKDDCNTFQNRPSITIAGGKPHIIFANGSGSGGDIYYTRLEGSQWINLNLSNSSGISSQNASLGSDGGNNLFAAWDEGIGNHDIVFKASFNGGLTWSDVNRLTNNPGLTTAPFVGWSTTTKRAYIVWHDQNTVNGAPEDIWEREFDPASKITSDAFQVSKDSGDSTLPIIAFGPTHADIVWQDTTTGAYQIYDLGGSLGTPPPPPPTGCTGTLALENGAQQTKKNPIAGAITLTDTTCGPTTMQISVDAPPASLTDPAPVSYSATPSNIQIPAGGCTHTVYVRVFGTAGAGAIFQDSIIVDNSVDADVRAVNPNMSGLATVYTQIAPADAYEEGARNGDANYTRVQKFFLSITSGNECSGLKNFYVPNTGEALTAIPSDGFFGSPALPGSANPGPRNVIVIVTDTLDIQRQYQFTLTYDPADTDPSTTVSNTLGLPVLDMTQSPTVTAPLAVNNVLVDLSFSNIHVTDNLYGDGTGPGTNDYWGVWIANSPTDVAADSASLNWIPVQVATPGASFSLQWSLFNGFSSEADRRAGPYFVYIRFLDGAGNPSKNVLKTKITLNAPYIVATDYMPFISR